MWLRSILMGVTITVITLAIIAAAIVALPFIIFMVLTGLVILVCYGVGKAKVALDEDDEEESDK